MRIAPHIDHGLGTPRSALAAERLPPVAPGRPGVLESRPVRPLFPLVVALAACGPVQLPPEPLASRADGILAATAAPADTDVFLLELRFSNGVNTICSAVLVSPRVLLTAAHCIDPAHQGAASVIVRAMNKPDDTNLRSSDFIDTTDKTWHPGWNAGASQSPFDIGLVLLATAPTNATPRPLLRTPPASWSGQQLRLVGYGRTAAGTADSGTRRTATVSVTTSTANILEFGTAGATGICAGDSGGPGFLRGTDNVERVAGIHSYTLSAQCGQGADIRVDANAASLIEPWIALKDPPLCTADGRCRAGCTPEDTDCTCAADATCNAQCPDLLLDPDCPRDCVQNNVCLSTGCPRPDPDCACRADAVCEPACPGGRVDPDCADCGANGRCNAVACPSPDPDCTCALDGTCELNCAGGRIDPDCPDCGANGTCSAVACPSPDLDCAVDGDVCTRASECQYGLCVQDPRGFTVCSRACTADADCIREMKCRDQVCRADVPGAEPLAPAVGGCAQAPGGLLSLLAALALRRRRARRE